MFWSSIIGFVRFNNVFFSNVFFFPTTLEYEVIITLLLILCFKLRKKSEDLYSKLQRIGQLLRRHYPKYDRMIAKREMKYGGLICVLEKFLGCPPEKRHAIKCKFSIGECAVPCV